MEEQILALIAAVCGEVVRTCPDLDLYEEGLLDSFGFIELLDAVEDTFGVEIFPTELPRAEANTPRKLQASILRRIPVREG